MKTFEYTSLTIERSEDDWAIHIENAREHEATLPKTSQLDVISILNVLGVNGWEVVTSLPADSLPAHDPGRPSTEPGDVVAVILLKREAQGEA